MNFFQQFAASTYMCLISFAYRQHPSYPLILVANRDEFFTRPSQAMHYWEDKPNLLAGRDLSAGGTWLGFNTQGRFAALTNYRDVQSAQPVHPLSRGALVNAALDTAQTLKSQLAAADSQQAHYSGYNLLAGDRDALYYADSSDEPYRPLSPGIYGLSNARLNTPWPKLERAVEQLRAVLDQATLTTAKLAHVLQEQEVFPDHQLPDTGISLEWERALSSQFIQMPEYGTRAKTIVLLADTGECQVSEISYSPEHAPETRDFSFTTALLSGR
ncbi:MAG: NRDE family protein [Pseudomonadales bacterium]